MDAQKASEVQKDVSFRMYLVLTALGCPEQRNDHLQRQKFPQHLNITDREMN